jgi:hypothetical protein
MRQTYGFVVEEEEATGPWSLNESLNFFHSLLIRFFLGASAISTIEDEGPSSTDASYNMVVLTRSY